MVGMFLALRRGRLAQLRRGARAAPARSPRSRPRPSRCCSSSAPCGKSAQLPLFVWLPDAMAGPTPVSALIHAATMVTAGVYLMTRVNPILAQAYDWVPDVIAWVGVLTALFAATIAVAQNDIKKVLAYSTVSQLGYMFLAVGVGRLRGRHLPHGHPRLLQGAALPRLRLGDPRHARRAGHAPHGRRCASSCRSPRVTFIVGWLAIAGVPPVRRLLVEGRDPALRLGRQPGAVGRRPRHRPAHRLLHEPPGVPGLLRRGALQARSRTGHEPVAPARVAVDDDAAARRARRPRHRRRRAATCPFTDDLHFLEHWLAPGGRRATRRELDVATGTKVGLARRRRRSPALVGIVARRAASTSGSGSSRSSPRSSPRPGTTTGRSPPSWAGPGRQGFEAVAAFDAEVVDGAVNGVGRRRARRRHGPARRSRPATSAATPSASPSAPSASSATSSRGRASDARSSSPARRRTASPPRRSPRAVVLPFVGAVVVALDPAPPARAAPARRPALRRRHRRHHRLAARRLRAPHDAGFQFEVEPRLDRATSASRWHLGVDGISLFLVVLTGAAVPARDPRASTPHHDQKPYYAWLLLLEAGCLGVFLRARPLPVLRDVRDRARADVLPHRRLGLRRARLRRHQVLPLHDARLGASCSSAS